MIRNDFFREDSTVKSFPYPVALLSNRSYEYYRLYIYCYISRSLAICVDNVKPFWDKKFNRCFLIKNFYPIFVQYLSNMKIMKKAIRKFTQSKIVINLRVLDLISAEMFVAMSCIVLVLFTSK